MSRFHYWSYNHYRRISSRPLAIPQSRLILYNDIRSRPMKQALRWSNRFLISHRLCIRRCKERRRTRGKRRKVIKEILNVPDNIPRIFSIKQNAHCPPSVN